MSRRRSPRPPASPWPAVAVLVVLILLAPLLWPVYAALAVCWVWNRIF